ncbi:MAG: hypothetical protein AAB509_01155, partial [Patescibacteria group bacterium]
MIPDPPVKLKPPRKKEKKKLYPMFRGMFFGLVFAGLFSAALYVFAVPPNSKYDFSETLSPSCTPGSTNCSVVSPIPYTGSTAAVSLGAYDFTVDTSTLYVDATNNRVGIGTTTPATRLDVTGLTINTDATGTVMSANLTGSITKNDVNAYTFSGLQIKPTLNTGVSNTGTTLNILNIDTTNTAVTGLTTNLIKASYGGTQKFLVDSSGNITAAGTTTISGLTTAGPVITSS